MELVVDANVLFSAAITDSKTAELMMRDDLNLYAPEYLFKEFAKYEETLLEKTHRERDGFQKFMNTLKRRIELVPKEGFEHRLDEARDVTPDPDDAAYFALALSREYRIWSDDRELQEQVEVEILTTAELIDRF
ncbi:MAG: PIN domain-containing protein [Candidatus Nanohalobium sp.]